MSQAYRSRIHTFEEETRGGVRGFWIGWASPKGSSAFMDTVAAIKALPLADRKYDPETKLWWVAAEMLDILAIDFEDLTTYRSRWQRPRYQQRQQQPPPRYGGVFVPPDTERAFQTLHLMTDAPVELVEAARRVYARMHHPDTGGSTAVMTQYNDAADKAKAWAKKQATCAA